MITFFRRIVGRLLHLYFRLTRGLTLGVRAVVLSSDGKVLLVRHTYTPGWHFPGGGVEVGECAETALANELWQETGLTLIGKPKLLSVEFKTDVSDRDHVLIFLCKTTGELLPSPASLEIAERANFHLEDLPVNADPLVKHVLDEIRQVIPNLQMTK